MARLTPLVHEIAERLRRLDLASVVYFHTDHFEPWRNIDDRVPAVGQEIVDGVHEFLRMSEQIDFARRQTLFYKPQINYAFRRDEELIRAHPDDLVGFLPRSEDEQNYGRAAMHDVATRSEHEIQLHIHHEYYTASRTQTDPAAVAWFKGPLGKGLDGKRLELAIRLNKEVVLQETDLTLDRWFFVHGQWALNGSDTEACTINDEIEILLANGCLGDFTFPPGRMAVNPRIHVPYFCKPHNVAKGYDLPEAVPEIAYGNAAAAAAGKFFIWACGAASLHCSLDYMSESSRRYLDDTEKAARLLVDGSYVVDRQLFIKTHAHAMHPHYFEHARAPVFPHQHPSAQALLTVIFAAATEAGIEVRFLTASEVYKIFVEARAKPEIDLVATYLQNSAPRRVSLADAAPARGGGRRRTRWPWQEKKRATK